MSTEIAELKGDARNAAEYREGHLQIIAAAGSGKTEVVSQRVAGLLEDGFPPESIVAFTFTERAAAALKSRIEQRVAARLGESFLDKLNGMFVGTIHSYCFRILQQHVPRYETYDVLDEHRLTAFLTREAYDLGIPKLTGKLFSSIRVFLGNVEVIENELLRPDQLDDPFREMYEAYLGVLEDHRLLTYGQQIARVVWELDRPEVFASVQDGLRHLIVDEYQDINPAQEALIRRLAEPPVHLCVVGDDDQSIYQWRGSNVRNILDFEKRYAPVQQFRLERNRRSRPEIIATGNGFSHSIAGRLPKRMAEHRPASGGTEVVFWRAETPEEEAAIIAEAVQRSHERHGYHYRDMAILCRGRVSFPAIHAALQTAGVPVQPTGRTNLFIQPDADLFGRTLCWLSGFNWRVGEYGWSEEPVTTEDLIQRYRALYGLSAAQVRRVRAQLLDWRERVKDWRSRANLVRDFYDLLGELGVEKWDFSDPLLASRLGTLARCSQVLVDYESTRRRAGPDHLQPGEVAWHADGGPKYYKWLAIYVQNWARGAYEGFEGEEDVDLDAVDLTTVHQAKGLEWPIVFVPALTAQRFPSSNTGKSGDWRVPIRLFDRGRYEGTETDERRLFYVAMTRSRDYLSLSTFSRINKKTTPSPFLLEVAGGLPRERARLPAPPKPEPVPEQQEVLEITFSDLAAYLECGLSFRLRRLIGFQPPLAPELGYGKAVHHVLRRIADHVRRYGRKPTPKQVERLFDDEFYLPAANPAAQREMRRRARELVDRHLLDWESDLHRVWALERPFELHLGDATVSGRADVILDEEDDGPTRLTIVDYKTAADGHDAHNFQLQVYTDAGRREGLVVKDAFVHNLRETRDAARLPVPVGAPDIEQAEERVRELISGIRGKEWAARPGPVCKRCDVRPICRFRIG